MLFNKKDKGNSDFIGFDHLHIGCGENIVDGWLNIGLFPKNRFPYNKLIKQGNAWILNMDIKMGIPVKKGSVKYIYASHFIEHLSFKEGYLFLKNCNGYMEKSGLIRLAFPNLKLWIKRYYENDYAFFQTYYASLKNYLKLPPLRTNGEVFMSLCYAWGHKWLYDAESMTDLLIRTGFAQIFEKKINVSLIPDIEKLELDLDIRRLETCYIEAIKKI
jgi:predicted SAM-dependent methyltransferase